VGDFPNPIPAWQVTGQTSDIGRFEALRAPSLSPLVGREEEIELLLRRWNRAAAGDGQVVLVSGEAGIGKSRIAAALRERLGDEPYLRLDYFCSALHSDSPLYPIVHQLQRAAAFTQDDDVGIKLAKLRHWVGTTFTSVELALLGGLLSLPTLGQSAETRDLAPLRKREKTLHALIHVIDSRARRQPVLITFEDVQWIDPTSRELLDLMIESIVRLPVLLIVTFRTELQPPWSGKSHVTMLTLNRLGPHDAAVLATRIAGDAALSSGVIAEIVERTDGIPLFIEELTRAILESGGQSRGIAHTLSTSPSPSLSVPATLHSSLMARLDRLGPMAKQVTQIGAVLGREFSFELLRAVAGCSEAELTGALERLTEAGIVWYRGTAPFSHYIFKHTLLQEAAYGTLLRGARQLLHSQAADSLISRSDEDASAGPEVIANHLQFAGRSGDAITYWRQAGEQAVQRAANREAIGHLQRALSLLEVQPETDERRRAELAILLQLGPALMSLHGWWASEVGEMIEHAGEVARGLKSSAELAPSLANLWSFNIARGRYDRAEENSRDLFRIARELDDPEILLQAHHTAQGNLVLRGEFAAASGHIDAALLLYDAERHAHHRYVYLGHDPGVCMLALSAMMQSMLGYPSAAVRREGEALIAGRGLGHAPSLAQALWLVCESQTARGDAPVVLDTATELLELSDEHGLLQLRSFALIFLGWALARSGETSEGIARLAEGLSASTKMGGRMLMTRSLCLMAESLLSAGRYAEGLEQVTRAFDIAAQLGEQWNLSRLHRVHAELLLQVSGPNDKKAEASLRQALAVARRQGARDWELRAATSLARLWVDHARHIDARRLLAPLYGRLANEIDAPDLGEARGLLDSLS
jgi:predicted ATPase